jgi:hypothetical protein
MTYELATAIFSGVACMALAWVMSTVHDLSVRFAVIETRLNDQPQLKGKKHANLSRLAAE